MATRGRLATMMMLAAIHVGAASPASAADPIQGPFGGTISGSVALLSDYTIRGVSVSKRAPSVQASLTYEAPLASVEALPVSLYGTVWGSSVNFSPDVDESLELDLLAGVRFKLFEGKALLDLGWIGYRYPGAMKAARLSFDEFGGSLSYDFGWMNVAGQVRYSPNFFAASGDAWYKQVAATILLDFIRIHDQISLKVFGGVGHQAIQRNARYAYPDMWDWQIGLIATAWGVDLGITYVDTNVGKRRCNGGGYDYCAARAIFSITKSF